MRSHPPPLQGKFFSNLVLPLYQIARPFYFIGAVSSLSSHGSEKRIFLYALIWQKKIYFFLICSPSHPQVSLDDFIEL